jgi:hypothetical protein
MVKYKAGDEVTVRARARDVDHYPEVGLAFTNGKTPELTYALYLSETQITTHTPKPRELKVGDVVGLEGAPECFRWVVLALQDDWAWLRGEESRAYSSARKTQIVRA